MMRSWFLTLAVTTVLVPAGLPALRAAAVDPMKPRTPIGRPVEIARAEQFDLRSEGGGRPYRIFLSRPAVEAPAAGYPVVYVLDGNAIFGTWTETVRQMERAIGPMVVVGIGYPVDTPFDQSRRTFDYTPITPPERVRRSSSEPLPKPGGTGGHDDFARFIESQVKPAVEQRVRIDRTRQALFGHSLAGLFVLHMLFTRPESFQTYLPASPSIWWNDRSVLDEERTFAAAPQRKTPVRVLFQVGELEQKAAPGTPPERQEFLRQARMVDNAREMAERLQALAPAGVRAECVEYAGETHGSVLLAEISRGLRFAIGPVPPR